MHHNAYVMRSGVCLTLVRVILYRYIQIYIYIFFAVDETSTWQATCAPPSKKQMSALKAQKMASFLERILRDNQIIDPLSVFAGHVQATADDCLAQIKAIVAIEHDTQASPASQPRLATSSRWLRGSAAMLPPLTPCGALSTLQVKLNELVWCIMQTVWSGCPTQNCWESFCENDTVTASEARTRDLEVYLTELINRPLNKWQRLSLFRAVDGLSDGLQKLGERLPWKEAELAAAACQRALGAM